MTSLDELKKEIENNNDNIGRALSQLGIYFIDIDIRNSRHVKQNCLVFELEEGMAYSTYSHGCFHEPHLFKNRPFDEIKRLKEEFEQQLIFVNKIMDEQRLRLLFDR